MKSTAVPVPSAVRLGMSRASAQTLAVRAGVRMLHIKGQMTDPRILPTPRFGSDVDVIADPAGLDDLHDELLAHGWVVYSSFDNGSAFGHAQTYFHPDWGHLDVHRRFPGIRVPDNIAFDALWQGHDTLTVAGIDCAVPPLTAQAVLYLLNCARDRANGRAAAEAFWSTLTADVRSRYLEFARSLDAEVAVAAACGTLDAYAHRPEYRLWKVITEGGTRTEEWRARIAAEDSRSDKARLIARAALVNRDILAHRLGRKPRPSDVATEFFRRIRRALHENGPSA